MLDSMNFIKQNNLRAQQEEEEEEEAEARMTRGYQECVEEIKAERKILGSLELHLEAMRRLKQNDGFFPEAILARRRRRDSEPRRFRSLARSVQLSTSQFANSFQVMGLRATSGEVGPITAFSAGRNFSAESSGSGGGGMMDPSKSIILGRRASTMARDCEFDPAAIAAQVRQDLELSDGSDWEDELSSQGGPPFDDESSSPSGSGQAKENGRSDGNRRPSLFRRSSSLFGENGGGGHRRPSIRRTRSRLRRAALRRRSSRQSYTVSSEESEVMPAGETKPASRTNEDEGSESEDERKDHDESVSTEDGGKSSEEQPPATRLKSRRLPSRGVGRRRSSLFSVNETKALINDGVGSSINSGRSSLGDSLTGSLTGSFSRDPQNRSFSEKPVKRASLICNFRHRNSSFALGSGDEFDDLICGWGRTSSQLSNSGVLSIQEDLLRDEEDGDRPSALKPHDHYEHSNRTLICGWDAHHQSDKRLMNGSDRSLLCDWAHSSQFSNAVLSASQNLEEEDEKILRRAKEGCALFDVRNG